MRATAHEYEYEYEYDVPTSRVPQEIASLDALCLRCKGQHDHPKTSKRLETANAIRDCMECELAPICSTIVRRNKHG